MHSHMIRLIAQQPNVMHINQQYAMSECTLHKDSLLAGRSPSAGKVCVGSGASSGRGTSMARIRAELGALLDGHVGCMACQQDDERL